MGGDGGGRGRSAEKALKKLWSLHWPIGQMERSVALGRKREEGVGILRSRLDPSLARTRVCVSVFQ